MEQEKEGGLKAKSVSLWGKIAMAALALAAFVAKGLGKFEGMTVGEISYAVFTVYAILVGTIDINIILSNLKDVIGKVK